VGSNPTPSALSTEKAPLTCSYAGRRGLLHRWASLTEFHLISLGLAPLPKYGPKLPAGSGCVARVVDVAARAVQQGRTGGPPLGTPRPGASLGAPPAVPARRQARHTKKPRAAEVAGSSGALTPRCMTPSAGDSDLWYGWLDPDNHRPGEAEQSGRVDEGRRDDWQAGGVGGRACGTAPAQCSTNLGRRALAQRPLASAAVCGAQSD
jgi:hypothetical protein